MASENKTEYKVVADKIVSPDNNINLIVEGNVYVGASEAGNRVATISDVGSGGGGPLVVPVNIKDGNDENFITFSRTGTGTARIETPQDDLSLRSARDITLFAGNDGPGNVYIGWGDAVYTPDSPNRVATIGDVQASTTADFVFNTVEAPDYESTMTVTNNDMVIKTVVDTEASGNIRVESTQDLTLDANGDILLESKNGSDLVKARIRLDQSNDQVLLEAVNEGSDWFNDTQWSTAVWSGTSVSITNTPDIIFFFDNVPSNVTRVSINNGSPVTYGGASYGPGDITIDVGGSPSEGEDPLTVTEIRFYYSRSSKIDINVDNGSFDIISGSMGMTIDSSGDLELTARDEDIDLRARDDIRFTTNWNSGGTQPQWRMTNGGNFELPGAGYISNPINSSGDGNGNDTIHLIPASNLDSDQYIIIDPTMAPSGPNHIHIRAGGTQDASTVDLILGGEDTNVTVSDTNDRVVIKSNSGQFLNDPSDSDNQIATIGDLGGFASSSDFSNDAWTEYYPTWTAESGEPLLGNGTLVGRYKQLGKTVFFNLKLTYGTTTTGAGAAWMFTLPVTAYDTNYHFTGLVSNTGGAYYAAVGAGAYQNSTTYFSLLTPADAATTTTWSAVTAANPFGLGSTDFLTVSGSYEAA